MPFVFELNELEKKAEEKILVKNTTREQRIEIVKDGCAFAQLNGKSQTDLEQYNDYIEGKKELREVVESIIRGAINE